MSGEDASENVAIAMALVIVAGGATGIGAAAVFVPSIVKLASRRVLAGSLGFSAGVMTYVSFVEIFQKANVAFLKADHDDGKAYLYATLCFFLGVLLMMLLNLLVAALLGGHGHSHGHGGGDPKPTTRRESTSSVDKKNDDDDVDGDDDDEFDDNPKAIITGPACCVKDPVNKLERIHSMADKLEHNHHHEQGGTTGDDMNLDEDIEDDFVDNIPIGNNGDDGHSDISDDEEDGHHHHDQKTKDENKRLVAMGMNTAGAIALHNFPEGLATFVAALDDPRVGAVLAVAIAIHNIPEGLCVALPIFYATGKRMNAFCWALLSGASEILAALLGWAVLAGSFTQNTYGVLFGIVSGMMVMISVRELLPTAHFYDPQDTVVTYSYICGMIVIALSLVLFLI